MSQIQSAISVLLSHTRVFESEIVVAFCVLIVAYFVTSAVRRSRSNLPPGPFGLPIVGYLPFLSENAHTDFLELGKKYGDVFSVKLGSETIVMLHGVEAIKEALSKPEFLGRPSIGILKIFNAGSAFFGDDVHKWREQRRFVVQSMKDLGLGRTIIEGEIMDEIHHFLEKLRSHAGTPMNVKEPLSPSMSNNICTLVFGKRYEYDDPDRVYLDKSLEEVNEGITQTSIVSFFPWILNIPLVGKLLNIDKAINALKNIKIFFRKEIQKHKDTFDSKHVRDFIDSFIVELDSRKKKNPDTTFSDETLVSNVLDLFAAGSETVRTSILWCLYVVAAFPESQERVRQEILEVMGPDRDPEFQDLKSVPFTHSFMLEVMRWKTIIPINVPHSTLTDTTLCGYHIPKNVTVLSNVWHAHHDPNYWVDPESFVPDRFITKDGKSVSRPSHFMPFSMGKRVCPGEPMAILEMFLYFTSILQKFQVVFPEGYKPTFKAALKGTYRLDPYEIRFLSRS